MFNDVSNELAMFEWTCFEMKKEKEKREVLFSNRQITNSHAVGTNKSFYVLLI